MADFPGMILTAAGRQLQAKAQIGQALTFTRVALGSGATPAQPEALTAMVDEEKSLSIQSFEVLGDGTSKMRVILTNQGVTEGFFVTEIGVFARDPDTLQEHLYSYSNSGAQSDFLPAEGGATVVEQIFDLITVVGTAQNVTALIDDFITIATKADVDELRPYIIPAAGTVGQMLRKATNAEGDAEWFDPSEGYDLRIASVSEVRTAVEGQSVFNLSQTITSGLAVYVDGLRLRTDEWDALNATQVRLDAALTAGQKVEFVNNEEVGAGSGGGSMVTLDGPSLVFPGSSNTLTITNHDSFSTYAVATDVGTAILSGAAITLDIPGGAAAGNLNLSVTRNGATAIFQIAIGAQSVARPSIVLPTNGAVDQPIAPTITANAFLTYPNGADTHASSDWEIATDSGFANVIYQRNADTSQKTALNVPSGTLSEFTEYHVRVRYNGSAIGASEWSVSTSFTTGQASGQIAYTVPGTYSFVVPAGVTSISVLGIGGGAGGAAGTSASGGNGGAGGGLAYRNNIAVTPGETLNLHVGAGGPQNANNPEGGSTSLYRGSATLANALLNVQPAQQPAGNTTNALGAVQTYFGGGDGGYGNTNGGGGGGGAAGYTGRGGNGGSPTGNTNTGNGNNGLGGGAGGGRGTGGTAGGRSGAGVGIMGLGASGAGGVWNAPAQGGSGGENATSGNGASGVAGRYGGGGAGGGRDGYSPIEPGPGAGGAMRIIWPGDTRQFPSTNVTDL